MAGMPSVCSSLSMLVGSPTRVTIRQASVEFLEKGLRITHNGISVELAPGVIEIGTR